MELTGSEGGEDLLTPVNGGLRVLGLVGLAVLVDLVGLDGVVGEKLPGTVVTKDALDVWLKDKVAAVDSRTPCVVAPLLEVTKESCVVGPCVPGVVVIVSAEEEIVLPIVTSLLGKAVVETEVVSSMNVVCSVVV